MAIIEKKTLAVDWPEFSHNPWGFWQMHGNVWEWCLDWYDENFHENAKAKQADPINDAAASARVVRGGSWVIIARYCRSALRYRDEPDDRNDDVGFRLAAVPRIVGAKSSEQEREEEASSA